MSAWIVALLVLVAFALVVLAYLASENYDVVREGRLFPEIRSDVYEVRLFDRFTVYVAPERGVKPLDTVNALVLAATAGAAFLAAVQLVRVRRVLRRARAFFVVSSLAFAYLAADEIFGLHETIGANARFLADLPGVKHPDDIVIALYLIPVVVAVASFWPVIFSSRRGRAFFAAAFAFYLLAALLDVTGALLDEPVEVLSSVFTLGGVTTIALEQAGAVQAAGVA
ncbi:MAG: hypothetical protein M3304_10720 [Actinomycetota bacterium]|nr:hypothetical protein [Actinomycetota bacterium]